MVIGHAKILDFFDKVIANGNLSHAYCFVGPAQVGKCTVAKYLAAKLLKVAPEKLSTQPDFTLVKQELNEKTGKTKQNIDIDQIRDLCAALSRYSFLGGGEKGRRLSTREKKKTPTPPTPPHKKTTKKKKKHPLPSRQPPRRTPPLVCAPPKKNCIGRER